MGAEPKRRHSKSRKRTRRAAIKLSVLYMLCKNCGKLTLSHIVCANCGFYGGKAITKEKVNPSTTLRVDGERSRTIKVTKV